MKILMKNNKILTAGNKPIKIESEQVLTGWGPTCKYYTSTGISKITGTTITVPSLGISSSQPWDFFPDVIPASMEPNVATQFSFTYSPPSDYSTDPHISQINITFLDGKSSIASHSAITINDYLFYFTITCTEEATVEFSIAVTFSNQETITKNYSFYAGYEFYTVNAIEGATYGFALNSNEYYESQNKGIDDSYAICKLDFNTNGKHLILDCINYAESNCDFGLLSNLNTTLSLSNSIDTTGVYKSFKLSNRSTVQTVDYGEITGGINYITIKYRKDYSVSSLNDSLQFKVRFE